MRFPILIDAYGQIGKYADRILSVELPPDLPVVRPTRFELAISLKAAKPVGLEVPPSSIARADEVFELDRLVCLWHV
jgi:putative tryptophan/tyrosine transport system substrate-binding protein